MYFFSKLFRGAFAVRLRKEKKERVESHDSSST
jgi:hypothetical protein